MLHNSTERNDEQAPLYLRLMPIRDAQQKAKEGSQDSMPPYPIDEEKDMLRRSFEIITKAEEACLPVVTLKNLRDSTGSVETQSTELKSISA